MKNRIALLVGCLVTVFTVSTATAGEQAGPKEPGKYVISNQPSMAEKGAFHKIHVKKVKTSCDDCHTKGGLPDNTLRVRLRDTLAKGDPGPVDAETCYDCHRRANKPLPFYVKKDQ